jgi:hypothetical protein
LVFRGSYAILTLCLNPDFKAYNVLDCSMKMVGTPPAFWDTKGKYKTEGIFVDVC